MSIHQMTTKQVSAFCTKKGDYLRNSRTCFVESEQSGSFRELKKSKKDADTSDVSAVKDEK